jgi:hypothetical protein
MKYIRPYNNYEYPKTIPRALNLTVHKEYTEILSSAGYDRVNTAQAQRSNCHSWALAG